MRVLIVDDEPGLQFVIKNYLESKNFEVSTADDGDEAFRLATSEEFDLIFLDVKMPGWSGIEAVKALDLVDKQPKFVMMSGYGLDEAKAELMGHPNVLGYMAKPFSLKDLSKYLDEINVVAN